MVRMRVLAGTSLSSLQPIPVNTDAWTDISSSQFEGRLAVQIKGYVGPKGEKPESHFFERADRRGKTWSVAFQGRFLEEISADELMFGNTFDRPISLPWGSSAVLSFMSLVDPTLSHDLQSQRPWAMSPAISSFPFMSHSKGKGLPEEKHPSEVLGEGGWELPHAAAGASAAEGTLGGNGNGNGNGNGGSGTSTPKKALDLPAERKAWFGKAENRKAVVFGPNDILTGDFCHSFLTFPDLSLVLPGGIKFDLKRYWDGQPVRFVCMRRPPKGVEPGDAEPFWVVQLEIVDDVEVVHAQGEGKRADDGAEDEDEDEDEFEDAEDGDEEDEDEGPPGGFSAGRAKPKSEDVD